MTTTIQAKRVKEALKKAQRIGVLEDRFSVDGCDLTLETLSPDQITQIIATIADLDETEYLYAYQRQHVSRSLVEVNGVDLRSDFIEDEVPNGAALLQVHGPENKLKEAAAKLRKELKLECVVVPPDEAQTKTLKVERHVWVERNIVGTWGAAALTVAWRKYSELLVKADKKVKEGIEFQIPDETGEERLRRLLNDIKDAVDDVPLELCDKLFGEAGFVRKTSIEEFEKVDATLRRMVEETPEAQEVEPSIVEAAVKTAQALQLQPEDLMRNRIPLTQQLDAATMPTMKAPTPSADVEAHPVIVNPAVKPSRPTPSRTEQIASLESIDLEQATNNAASLRKSTGPVELKKQVPIDQGFAALLDKPPVAGLNPRFKRR